jgi:hypothetical protein
MGIYMLICMRIYVPMPSQVIPIIDMRDNDIYRKPGSVLDPPKQSTKTKKNL